MKKIYLLSFIILLLCYIQPVKSQHTLTNPSLQSKHLNNVAQQINLYFQEKIHLHIDKNTYLTTDTIWLRAYLVHATFHTPLPISRYTYIELINPLGAIVERIQLKARRRLFFGHIALSDTLPDGDYTLRAYTDYMANTTKDYLFKRKIKIISPKWGNVKMKVTTKGTTPNSSQLIFQFNHNDSLFSVHHLEAILKKGKSHIPERQKRKDQFEVEFTEKVMETNRSFRLRLTDRLDNKYERFLPIATDKEQYNVFFYPEGGSLVNGVSNRIAIKAIGNSGNTTALSLCIRDDAGDSLTVATTKTSGVGVFEIVPQNGKQYYAHCMNLYGTSKIIPLPNARSSYGLRIEATDSIFQAHLQTSTVGISQPLYLIAHVRGAIVSSQLWKNQQTDIILDKKLFPEGIIQFMLLDQQLNPLCERLVFSKNYRTGNCYITTNKTEYGKRESITVNLTINDPTGNPVQNYFSVSVTDAETTSPDTCHTIQSSLLLTNELKGNISSPALWLTDEKKEALDYLMMTHKWERYSIPAILKGQYEIPHAKPEQDMCIQGKTYTQRPFIGNIGKASDRHAVIVTGTKNMAGYQEIVMTNSNGEFKFDQLDFPENSGFRILVRQSEGKVTDSLNIIPKRFPVPNDPFPQEPLQESIFSNAESENLTNFQRIGNRHYLLHEVKIKSPYWGTSNYQTLTEKEISLANDMKQVLQKMGLKNIMRDYNSFQYFHNGTPVVIFLDNYLCDPSVLINWLSPEYLREITFITDVNRSYVNEMLKGTREWSTKLLDEYGQKDLCELLLQIDRTKNKVAVLNATTKSNFDSRCFGFNSNKYISPWKYGKTQLSIYPLGYQLPVEFYSPQYDNISSKENLVPDLRTTLFWKPNIKTDINGRATFTFYTSDNPGPFFIIVEGITDKGEMIRATKLVH